MTSDDFINLSTPPRPKDSPSMSEFTTPDGSWNQQDPRRPHPLQRRASTNYTDALNIREMGKQNRNQLDHPNSYEENRHYTPAYGHDHGYPTKRMEFQDIKHDRQHWKDYVTQSSSTVDMGDHVQHQSNRHNTQVPEVPPQLNKSDYLDENDRNASLPSNDNNNNKAYTTQGRYSKPQLFRRRSSFEYEDFKKDIYDRLRFFDG